MKPFDQEIIQQRVEGATTQEQVWMIRCLPTKIIEEELNRRNVAAVTVLNQLKEAIYSVSKDMSLQDMEKLIKDVKNISKCKKKVIEVKEEQNVQE